MLWKYIATALVGFSTLVVLLTAAEPETKDQRAAAQKLYSDGNYAEALAAFQKLALSEHNDKQQVGSDLEMAIHCLQNLGREDEIDALRERVIETHDDNWRLLHTAANTLLHGNQYGFIVAGEFYRGNKRGGGEYVNSIERDRVRALQLLQQATALVEDGSSNETDTLAVSRLYLDFARALLNSRGQTDAWRLQVLTDLSTLPDYEQGYRYGPYGGGTRGAPVDEEGNPVFHQLPENYAAAQTDGERWRWMLHRAAEVRPDRKQEIAMQFAGFLRSQFGVQTMRYYGRFFASQQQDGEQDESGPYALASLDEDETVARLAVGVKRFELPDEFNFIRVYQQVAEGENQSYAASALEQLAQIFEDRRQYPQAAQYWRQCIRRYGPGTNGHRQQRLEQIVGEWGRFEGSQPQTAGQGATVEYRFRNGEQVTFQAHRILVDKLLQDVQVYLKSNPRKLDWQQLNIQNIGHRLVEQQQTKYLGDKVAEWQLELKPRENHFDRRITVDTPLEQAGAYLVTARMKDGNVSRIILWLNDTVIAKKQLDGKALYYVADAEDGKPVDHAHLEFFGYRQENIGRNRYAVRVSQFAEYTDANGQSIPDPKDLSSDYQWVVVARTKQGRFAYLGFDGIWYGRLYDSVYQQNKVFVTTDRPVYRPDQTMKFKFWVRKAQYDMEDVSQFAHQSFTVRITNPKGESVLEKQFTSDEFGGFDGEFPLPEDATLGQYHVGIVRPSGFSGGGHFRVEEYKKPEYEVTVEAPDEPVQLGESITATIHANYYFGAPVVNAKVHYKVTRSEYSSHWYPVGIWDWFYGSGYWWFAYDYEWYPGWHRWGCVRPVPFWWPVRHDPPEVVLDNEVEIGPDGTVQVVIDTALAKEMHGDSDHRYEITAEVVDQSRRTIVGTGEVLVAREPFQVFAWVDRGHYRTGDVVHAHFKAQTLDRKGVQGDGQLKLYRVTYDENSQPVETEVQAWDLDTNDRGEADIQIKASEAGQYRLSYKVTDSQDHTIEGGYVFVVVGEGFDGSKFRFNDIELITDKREYEPGDTVKVMINTNRVGSTVLLFVRPANGVYPEPTMVRLDGKSTVHDVAVVKKDMPNFFIEAMTISGGKIYSETREVIVPPEKRVANVEVLPSATEYQPGAAAEVQLKLTDLLGHPFVGSTVLTIYDKSVEYISGGSNVPEIKEFFWKFRRSHHPSTNSNLARYFANLLRSGETPMNNLGAFGDLIFDEDAELREEAKDVYLGRGDARGKMRAMEGAPMPSAAPMAQSEAIMADDAGGGMGAGETGEMVQPTVRKNFADTALWLGAVTADENGVAKVTLTMPESLTTWKVRAWTMGHGTKVGQGEAEIITTKNLLVRMQAPRFFTETDEVVLSANVHNYLATAKAARVVLELEGDCLEPLESSEQLVEIEADGELRVDWHVKAVRPGEAVVRMKALTDEESDAMELRFPVFVHGMLRTESYTGVILPDGSGGVVEIDVPAQRRISETLLEVRYSPTLAGAMVDALPYLVNYPHKTTDTTLTRFLPTVVVQNILLRMNLDLEAIKNKRTNLNAQEIGDDVERAAGWKRYDRNPVFDQAEVQRMVKQGVKALTEMQLGDGGWGWFSGWGERSDPHTTALVVHGLQLAVENDVAIVPDVLQRGVTWLENYQKEQVRELQNGEREERKRPYKLYADNTDALVYMVLIDAGKIDAEMQRFLYRDRTRLSVYAKALFGLALHKQNEQDQLAMIIRNIDQFLVQDDENQTAYLKLPDGTYWWYWYGSETEANAFYLKLLAKTDPNGEKASRLVKYLLNNRKHATYWRSTRDTAFAIEALAEYLTASGQDKPEMTVEVYFNGKKRKEVEINSENLFSFDNKFVLAGDAVESGRHRLELRRKGGGRLYYNAYLTNFTLEDFIEKAGLEIKVNRKYYRLIRDDQEIAVAGSHGQAFGQRVEKYRREELPNFSELDSGDLVEIELEIDSKNDYEYLVFEDMKAAGFEPVEVRSGYNSNSLGAYMELRDERVALFVRRLARGKHSISFRMRAETPGRFSALPTKAYAMYAPELKANSDEIKLTIVD